MISMDMELELGIEEIAAAEPRWKSIVPKVGCFLGLDISKNSSGITVYINGDKFQYNISLNEPENGTFREVLYRRFLKSELLRIIRGMDFNVIVIEDAYQGENPETTRLLYALNTGMDELILDGEVSCDKYLRVSNGVWKSWLFSVDEFGSTKGYNDKVRIQMCMEMLGIKDSGEGSQDRLDSDGMLLGYFLKGKDWNFSTNKKVTSSDIDVFFELEEYDVVAKLRANDLESIESIELKGRVYEKTLLEILTENPNKAFVSSNYVKCGYLATKYGFGYIADGGILGFRVKKSKLKKYWRR